MKIRSIPPLIGLTLLASVAGAEKIIHDAEFAILQAQNGEAWAADDLAIDKKLAELREKNGGKPPNIVYILLDDVGFGEIGMDELSVTNVSSQIASLSTDLKKTINNTNRLVNNLNQQVDPMAKGFIDTTDAATNALNQARDTLSLEKGPGADLVASIHQAVASATSALEQADTTLQTIDALAGEESEVIYALDTALEEIAMAARSIRTLAEYLERHPESLLRGKSGKGGQ